MELMRHTTFFTSFALLALAGCGGETTSNTGSAASAGASGASGTAGTSGSSGSAGTAGTSGSGGTAGSGGSGGACFSPDGSVLSTPFKLCTNDSECTVGQHATDCCGGIQQVGIAASEQAAYAECESAWVAHFPECGCASNANVAEDGVQVMPGNVLVVSCTDFVGNSGICKTYVIPGAGGAAGGGGGMGI